MKVTFKIALATSIAGFVVLGSSLVKTAQAATFKILQETAPNSGKFAEKGRIEAFETTKTIEQYYNYSVNSPNFNGFTNLGDALPSLSYDTSHIVVVNSPAGVSVLFLQDKPNDVNTGQALMRFDITGAKPSFLVKDDPTVDVYTSTETLNGVTLTANQSWPKKSSDGVAIGLLSGNWALEAQFPSQKRLYGLNQWKALSEDGQSLDLALEMGRRVRIEPILPQNASAVAEPGSVMGLLMVGVVGGVSLLRRSLRHEAD